MRWTPEIEAALLEQIKATPDREVILPDWASWKGTAQPRVFVDGFPEPVIRYMHEKLIGPLKVEQGVVNGPGVDQRNVNPFIGFVVPSRHAKSHCTKGHRYHPEDWTPGVGHRCEACHQERLTGKPDAVELNRSKTHCPQGHEYTKKNTTKLKSGRRRCRTCAREQSAAYRLRQKG